MFIVSNFKLTVFIKGGYRDFALFKFIAPRGPSESWHAMGCQAGPGSLGFFYIINHTKGSLFIEVIAKLQHGQNST